MEALGKKYNAVLQQTMLRIKDPKVSVPFYEKHFGMQLVHKYDFPQWKFSLYFLERPSAAFEGCGEPGTPTSENYLWNMTGQCTLELTHNHGSEDDPDFSVWSGNGGRDLPRDSSLFIENGPVRGFGHVAFNVDDVYAYSAALEEEGVRFQKKPDEGRMKGLAFCLDPDGYWIELVARSRSFPGVSANLSQTMLRVKDAAATVDFYQNVMGMQLMRKMEIPNDFTNYFLTSVLTPDEKERYDKEQIDPNSTEASEFTHSLWYPILEITHNHGTESDEEFQISTGNDGKWRGFGHIGFIVDDLEGMCHEMIEGGVPFHKKPEDGNMRQIAFALDPSGYHIELIQRDSTFKGVCSNF